MANFGMYHPTYNPNGSRKASDDKYWYETSVSFTSISDCFTESKLLAASGTIASAKNGRPDNRYADQVHEGDILDLRNSSKKVEDYNRLISRELNKLVAGTYRGKEGEWQLVPTTIETNILYSTATYFDIPLDFSSIQDEIGNTNTYKTVGYVVGNNGTIYNIEFQHFINSTRTTAILNASYGDVRSNLTVGNAVYVCRKSTRTKSNTLLHCDIIGNPTNYPASWKQSGVFGTPLIVAEDGTSLLPTGSLAVFKVSRKANATPLLVLKSTDSGATWTALTVTTHYTFSTTTNTITMVTAPATTDLIMVYYQTHTSMAVPVVNSEVLEIGKVLGTNGVANAFLVSSLINKVSTSSTAPYLQDGYSISAYRIDTSTIKFSSTSTEIPIHSSLALAGGASGVSTIKVLPYLTRANGKAYLNLVFKEMKHNGTTWGDDSKFNIVDNISTTTDNNAQTVLIGQKTVELPYFIGADE